MPSPQDEEDGILNFIKESMPVFREEELLLGREPLGSELMPINLSG